MKHAKGPANRPWIGIGTLMLLSIAPSAFGAEMRFFPIRLAPLGSPAGTIGDPVTPEFNSALGCWELVLPGGGVEVDIDLQAFGWGGATCLYDDAEEQVLVPCPLGSLAGTVKSTGYDNGVGAPLIPKGWSGSPGDGAYQATHRCTAPPFSVCTPPFDPTCGTTVATPPFCLGGSPNWIIPSCASSVEAILTDTLDYTWLAAALSPFCNGMDEIDDSLKTFGGLIIDVPTNAAGTYLIAFNPDPNLTIMGYGDGSVIPDVALTPACITIIRGACCMDNDADGHQETCQNDTSQSDCEAAGGTFRGDGIPCSGLVGACCFDSDSDGFDDTCVVMERDCCLAEGGLFRGNGSTCSGLIGACCLDSDGDDLDDTCRVMDQTCCDGERGSFGGSGSRCSNIDGACCLDEGACLDMNQTCCESLGGSSAGVGSVCEGDGNNNGTDDACDEGFPAVSQWGLIVLVLLLLVGIKTSFDRRQPV